MKKLGTALIGAGFMGGRHLLGYAALARAGYHRLRLDAIVDLDESAAHRLADEAQRVLGSRPRVYTDAQAMLDAEPGVDAVDLVTDPRTHHTLAIRAMEAGRHVLCEKPLALTIKTGAAMVDAATRTGRVLATGENYRRGGSNRLAKAVIDAGLLGELFLYREVRVGGDDRVIISPWRHRKRSGSIGLDMPIHYADLIEYFLGPVDRVWGRGFIAEPHRRPAEGGAPIDADGEDSLVAAMTTVSGVDVHLAYVPSGRSPAYGERVLHGRRGSLRIPADRTDGDVVLHLDGETWVAGHIRELLPDFELDTVTRAVLGSDGTGGKGALWSDVDAGHLAVEIADFVDAALDDRSPEVDGVAGLRALAVVLAGFESGLLGRDVSVDEILARTVHGYQDEIDDHLEEREARS